MPPTFSTHALVSLMISLTIAGSAFVFSLAVVSLLIGLAPRLGLVDQPGGRKEHTHQSPVVGGLGIAITLLVALTMLGTATAVAMAAAIAIILAAGVGDDLHELSPLPKFILQGGACLVMYLLARVELHSVGNILGFGPIGMWWFALPITIVAVIGVINAMNMTDGIDGHAGAIGLITFSAYAYAAWESGLWDQFKVLLALIGATGGFLVLNLRSPFIARSKTFLGDAGSMLLGFMIGWFAIDLTQGPDRSLPPICALWIIIIPLCDCVSLMIRRKLAGRSMFTADRAHFHHYLLNRGLSVGRATAVSAAINASCALIGLIGWKSGVPEVVMFGGFVILFVAHHWHMTLAFRWMPHHSAMGDTETGAGPAR